MAAEIERKIISQRTREALARRKAESKQLGRPKGSFGVSRLDKHQH
jgi:DNA invertase Pin-like site-specific DNA recombinase